MENYHQELISKYRRTSSSLNSSSFKDKKILKIGYISHCLKQHSVGWISRWLFKYHNHDKFKIYTYIIGQKPLSGFSQYWFTDNSDQSYSYELMEADIIKQIAEDEIDILVDLDSITFDTMLQVMTIKPAPIQVTWLGWDASGLPTVDYYLADHYVLPDYAQEYYTETIWRLPQTYVAVDGFEVDVPSLKREHLDIPSDAIVYFIVQGGYKRNPDNLRLQMKILKEVNNSYLLIKGRADKEFN